MNKLLKKGSILFAFMAFFAMTHSVNAQYCVPEGTNDGRYIDNFSTTGGAENISNLSSGFSTGGYGDFTATHTVTQSPGETIAFSADVVGGTAGFRIWVDWNQDGTFDVNNEVTYISNGYSSSPAGSFMVPTDALEGETRMRVVSHWLSTTGDIGPCETEFNYGEFEDYTFNVLIPEACTGTPEAGVAALSPSSGNAGDTYVVSATGYTVADELSFQWQSNTNGAGWVDEGANTALHTPYTATAPSEIGDEVEWRLAVTCAASGETGYSETATFTVELTYCNATSTSVEPITRVIFSDVDNSSPAETSSPGYEDFTSIVANVEAGETYSFAGEGNTNGPYTTYFTVWIDWNVNGDFEESEKYEIGSIVGSDGTDGQQAIADITVPTDAVAGETRMRVRKKFNSFSADPCGSYSFGQTEDYTVNVGGGGGSTFPAPYCDIADGDEVIVEPITAVEFADTMITNDDDTSVLVDKTDIVVDVTAGDTYTLSVQGSTEGDFDNNIVAFIDWNQNDILDDAGEIYELGTLTNSTGNDGVSVSMEIDVPTDAVIGNTRVRITKTYTDADSPAEIDPCGIVFSPFGQGIFPGYGQALDFTVNVEEASNADCGQGDESNGFENGFNITDGGDFRNADDFMVSADNTLNIRSIELNLLSMQPITSLNINFYNDDNGAPGTTVVESVTEVVPYAQVAIGTAFGYTVYAVLVEVDLNFEGGSTGTSYWMQPSAVSAGTFWEVTSVGTLGEPIHNSEAGGAWEADPDGNQAVFTLHCDVATPPDAECLFGISTVEPITRFVMANVDNASSADSTIALEDFTDTVIMASAGESYDVALEGNTAGPYTNYFTVFLNTTPANDWSEYETYEIGFIEDSSGNDGQQATNTITIPGDLAEGEYILRVVKNYNTSPMNPCSSYSFGQGEDYTLMVGEMADCSGTPDAGTASVSPEQGAPGSDYTVSATGYSAANGLTFQWQSNTDGAGWVNEGDLEDSYSAFNATAPATEGAQVEWRLEVTCTISSESALSETATFTTTGTSAYCTPVLDCTDGDMITNVTFEDIDNTTTCSPDGYGDYTAMAATVQAGGEYPIMVTVGDGWNVESVSVWVDFNDNGEFEEAEFFYIGTGSGETLNSTISIPTDAANGDYRMRVRVAAVPDTDATFDMACDEDQGFGETEDYTVTVDGMIGTDDYSATDFTYYPNPMEDVLNITSKNEIESISVYNVLGQQVLNNKHFADGKMDVSSLTTGTFMFHVTFKSGEVENFHVVKK